MGEFDDVTIYDGMLSMAQILSSLGLLIWLLTYLQTPNTSSAGSKGWRLLPDKENNLPKYQFEVWALGYTCVWIGIFAVVVFTKVYEQFTANIYMGFLVTVATPYLLQPFVWPLPAEKNLPFYMRYSFKANLWIACFSFIGNYWYTHYFYSVLRAFYDFPSHRLNNVPICLYFATHFYFVTYHTFSNLILRQIETRYSASFWRSAMFWTAVLTFSYFTAFMETLTISSFEHYGFYVARSKIYTLGSAFYGIYFIVSYPMFYRIDEKVNRKLGVALHSVYQVVVEVMGTGMLVLLLLDFARLALGVPLVIPGAAFCENENLQQCAGV
jgi:cycloeucalenol cycloisomerase